MDGKEEAIILRRLKRIELEVTFPKLTDGQRLALQRERTMLENKLMRAVR